MIQYVDDFLLASPSPSASACEVDTVVFFKVLFKGSLNKLSCIRMWSSIWKTQYSAVQGSFLQHISKSSVCTQGCTWSHKADGLFNKMKQTLLSPVTRFPDHNQSFTPFVYETYGFSQSVLTQNNNISYRFVAYFFHHTILI